MYGPGGPFAAVDECAKAFGNQNKIVVKVVAGPEATWINAAKRNADIIFGGAEYMLTEFAMKNKGLVDSITRTELYKRAAAILVRPGNPKHIHSLKDLAKPGIKIMDVNGAGQMGMLEDLAGKQNLINPIQRNIGGSYGHAALGIEAWKADKGFDAWITFASWYNRLTDITALVKIPPSQQFTGNTVELTTISKHRETALRFISFMQSLKGHLIFKKWGWQ